MKQIIQCCLTKVVLGLGLCAMSAASAWAQQLPNAGFEDWSGTAFNGNAQPANWNASNVTQFSFKFNFAHKEDGHTGSASMMVQDQSVGAAGISEVSPGYFSLGQPWAYVPSLTAVNQATAGTDGGVSWTYRPDSMSVWIKRTGGNVDKEDFYLLYYAWSGTAKSSKYKGKNGTCTSTSHTNEESDIRQALDGNECGTEQKVTQIAEGMWREKKEYGDWTNIRVPIYYFNSDVPTMMNIIFSASNYPNFRATSGLYAGNSLYVDDVELIYSADIQKIYIDDKEWKGFDPSSSEEQTYSLGRSATTMPKIEARRGTGALTNAKGITATFAGRVLSGKEITIQEGVIDGTPTVITVKAEDGSKTKTYKIKFVREASKNSKLADIQVNGKSISNFNANTYSYSVDLPYGTTAVPVVTAEGQEDAQTIEITQPAGTTGRATIKVTAADKQTISTYTLNFRVAELADNTLKDILINGKSLTGFIPSQTIYRVSLPTTTTTMPTVQAVSAYPAGAQTIQYTAPTKIDGGTYQIAVTTPGNAVPKTYKLNFRLEASSYSLLKDLQVEGEYITDFAPDNYTYYVTLPMGTTALPKIQYELGDEFQSVSIVEGGLDGTTRITVTAANGDQTVYKIVFTTLKSEISTLAGIRINGVDLPDFSPDKTEYTCSLPIGTTEMPTVEPIKGDEYQSVTILLGGLNGTTRITVAAGNGNTTVYQITFSVQQATNATLKMIYIDGVELEGFDKDQLEYTVNLPQGTTKQPVVTYTQNDEYQTVTVRSGSSVEDDYKITVRPQTGASRTYIIHFRVATSSNTALKMIYVAGTPLADFDASVLNYTYTLPAGVSAIPSVSYDKAEASQKVLSMCENTVHTITVTAENGDKRTYTITFIIQKSENAFLRMIYLDGQPLSGFDKNKLTYTVALTKATCPRITVDKENGQQVTITTPYAAGVAQIRVTPESGSANTYSITFTSMGATASVALENILLDGVALTGFVPTTLEYTVPYSDVLPEVSYTAESGRTVEILRKGDDVMLYVQAGEEYTTYTLHFQKQVSADCTLRAILIDGTPLAEYTPATTDYTIDLPAGSKLPVVSFEKANESQVTYFGQSAPNTMAITVVAPSGTEAIYKVSFRIAQYDDARLRDLQVEGHTLAFDPDQTDYQLTLEDGAALPHLIYSVREGQNIVVANTTADQQQVLVHAESGATKTYTITYTRVMSSNAYLSDIRINGVSLADFEPTRFVYTDTLAWRTRVVPNVFAVGQLPNQTITTYFSAVNGTTRIHVVAADGTTSNDYTIAFPVRKSGNVALEDMYLNSEMAEITFAADQTDYEVWLPYQSKTVPDVVYTKAEPEQTIALISRPLGQKTEIVVTAENGNQRTYSIWFRDSVSQKINVLDTLRVRETGELLNVAGNEFNVALPYGTRTLTVDYTKAFDEQTVWIQPGGINHPTIITVRSNRPDEADHIYTLTPQLETQNPAVLEGITIDGKPLEGFDKNRFSYVVNVTNTPVVDYTESERTKVLVQINTNKQWRAKVTAQGQTNIYDLWFYYTNDTIPNGEFSEWTTTKYNDAQKPIGWQVLADAAEKGTTVWGTYKSGDECKQSDAGIAYLKTAYSGKLMRSTPGFMTLGTISGELNTTNSFQITGGISFKNSPDTLKTYYKAPKIIDFNRVAYVLSGSNGTYTAEHNDSKTFNDYQLLTIDLAEVNQKAGMPNSINLIFNSNWSETGNLGSSGMNTQAEMYVDWVRFMYNSTLTSLKVNGLDAALNANAFSVTLSDPEAVLMPSLVFTGQVADQAQKITWQEETTDGEYVVRNADIINYAEDGTSSNYTLQVRRPLDTRNTLTDLLLDGSTIRGFNSETTDYTVHLASDIRHLPSVYPQPASSLQTITTAYADSVLTITVSPEKGESKVYTIRFVTDLSDDTTLANLSNVSDFAPETRDYTINATTMPTIAFVKQMNGQTVEATFSATKATLVVTAENGAKGTYTLTLNTPVVSTSGQLSELAFNGNIPSNFAEDNYAYTLVQPALATFVRKDEKDSVVFVQTPQDMQWQVFGTEQHTYTLTYPTDPSSNTRLRAILLNGKPYADFDPAVNSYTLHTNTLIHLSVQKSEDAQKVQIALDTEENTYTIQVVSEKGTMGTPYIIKVKPALSSNSQLASILLDDSEIASFDPATMQYTITLPAPAVKLAEPRLPSLRYVVGDEAQKVEMTAGRLGSNTYLTVTSEDGKVSDYSVLVQSEPSHNADLTGIIVNGVPVAHFETGRHYYSVRAASNDVDIEWTADDNFQTVTRLTTASDIEHVLHVVAQDGVNTQDYTVEVYVESLSTDATLADLWLDGQTFSEFEHTLNPHLAFSSMQNSYQINLPAGSTVLPEVSASLRVDGQQVSITTSGMNVYMDVTAPDGVTRNRYTLTFVVPLSANADLGMIYLDGDSLPAFSANRYYYPVTLPVGVHAFPEVVAQKAETNQQITTHLQDNHITINVIAEDGITKSTYTVVFAYTLSDADTLQMIYADEVPVVGFAPRTFYYHLSLPVGTTVFPELAWTNGDEWQNVRIDTLQHTDYTLARQLVVTSESGRSNYYTVAYSILQSSVDTLKMIYIDEKPLADFVAATTEYWYTVPANATEVPSVYPLQGDDYQTVKITQSKETMAAKSLDLKTEIEVIAANGTSRTYIIHYPKELSSETDLDMIFVGGKNLSDFDSERFFYRVPLSVEIVDIPLVTVAKKEDAQQVEIATNGDTVFVHVTAENRDKATYTLAFERIKSANANLQNISLGDGFTLEFESAHYDYAVTIPYGQTQLPTITAVKAEDEQLVELSEPVKLPTGEQIVTILVTAPNGIDQCAYTITFSFAKNNDASLTAIYVRGKLLEGFRSDSVEYTLEYPVGSTIADFAGLSEITYTLSDGQAHAETSMDNAGTVLIAVTAQDGSVETYLIHQIVLTDTDNTVRIIYLDDAEFAEFDPEQDFYIYYIIEGLTAPKVSAEAASQYAEISVKEASVGDTCIISCTSQSGETRRYYIWFAQSELNDALTPTANDVLVKRLSGSTQILVGTLRKDVSFGLYDMYGHRIALEKVPVADPNDVEMVTEANGQERLLNITDLRSGTILTLDPNTIYFYVFFHSEKQRIVSGKLIVVP